MKKILYLIGVMQLTIISSMTFASAEEVEVSGFVEVSESTSETITEETVETSSTEEVFLENTIIQEENTSRIDSLVPLEEVETLVETLKVEEINLYGTIIKKNYPFWSDLSFKEERYHTSQYFESTLFIKEAHHHKNGFIYYLVSDNKNNILGFVNSSAVKLSDSRGGIYFTKGKYGTIRKKNYPLWQSFNFDKERNNTNKLYEKTYLIKGEYHHFNGSVYYSVYDNQNKWLGYVNQSAISIANNRGGTYFSKGNYGTIVKKNYPIWQNFSFNKERNNSNSFYEKTLLVKGEYHHFNGSVYYSIYDNQDRWLGYMNQSAAKTSEGGQGVAIKSNLVVALPNNNYPIWQNFSWVKRSNTNHVKKKKYVVKYQYHHFNGSVYHSVYDGNKWLGYLNNKGSRKLQEKNGVTFIDNMIIANKKITLPNNFKPGEDREAGKKVRSMIYDMKLSGLSVSNSYSGFRTYQYQELIYNDYVRTHGQAKADTFAARPGHSEHQTGLTFDLRHSNGTLIETGREANWLANNAHKYGFIIRYQKNKTPITGYQAEPWHVRYVGETEAKKIKNSGLTLEEYLGVPGGDYK